MSVEDQDVATPVENVIKRPVQGLRGVTTWLQGLFLFQLFMVPVVLLTRQYFSSYWMTILLYYVLGTLILAVIATPVLIGRLLPDDNHTRHQFRILTLYTGLTVPINLSFLFFQQKLLFVVIYYLLPLPSLIQLQPETRQETNIIWLFYGFHLSTLPLILYLTDLEKFSWLSYAGVGTLMTLPIYSLAAALLNLLWHFSEVEWQILIDPEDPEWEDDDLLWRQPVREVMDYMKEEERQ